MNVYDAPTTCNRLHEDTTDESLALQWTTIDWEQVEKHVNRIQISITKTVQ